MNFATKPAGRRILVWLIWVVALVVYRQPMQDPGYPIDQSVPLLAVCRREIFFSNENNVKLRAIISELQTS